MSLQCPECTTSISRIEALRLMRLFSINCPRCQTLLALDTRGRAALSYTPLAAMAACWLVYWLTGSGPAAAIVLLVGFFLAPYLADRMGRLGYSPEA